MEFVRSLVWLSTQIDLKTDPVHTELSYTKWPWQVSPEHGGKGNLVGTICACVVNS